MKKEKLLVVSLLLPLLSACVGGVGNDRRLPAQGETGDSGSIPADPIGIDEVLAMFNGDLSLSLAFSLGVGGKFTTETASFYYDEGASRFDLNNGSDSTVFSNDAGLAVTYEVGIDNVVTEQTISSPLVSFDYYYANPFARIGIEDLGEEKEGVYPLSGTMASYVLSRLLIPANGFNLMPLGTSTGSIVLSDGGFSSFSLAGTAYITNAGASVPGIVDIMVAGDFSYEELQIEAPKGIEGELTEDLAALGRAFEEMRTKNYGVSLLSKGTPVLRADIFEKVTCLTFGEKWRNDAYLVRTDNDIERYEFDEAGGEYAHVAGFHGEGDGLPLIRPRFSLTPLLFEGTIEGGFSFKGTQNQLFEVLEDILPNNLGGDDIQINADFDSLRILLDADGSLSSIDFKKEGEASLSLIFDEPQSFAYGISLDDFVSAAETSGPVPRPSEDLAAKYVDQLQSPNSHFAVYSPDNTHFFEFYFGSDFVFQIEGQMDWSSNYYRLYEPSEDGRYNVHSFYDEGSGLVHEYSTAYDNSFEDMLVPDPSFLEGRQSPYYEWLDESEVALYGIDLNRYFGRVVSESGAVKQSEASTMVIGIDPSSQAMTYLEMRIPGMNVEPKLSFKCDSFSELPPSYQEIVSILEGTSN